MTVITTNDHVILDSSGQPAEGVVLFTQSARFETSGGLVTTTQATVTVKHGRIERPNPFNLPATPDGEGVLVVEKFTNRGEPVRPVSFWVSVPSSGPVEYADLPQITVPTAGPGVPSWAAELLDALESVEGVNDPIVSALLADDVSLTYGATEALVAGQAGNPATPIGAALSSTFVRVLKPEAFGAVGNGIADDLPAFRAIEAVMNATPAGFYRVEITGTHYVSDGINFDAEVVEVFLGPDAHVFTTAATSVGHTLGCIGYLGLGVAVTPQRRSARFTGTGRVTGWRGGSDTVNNENAIGIVRFKEAIVDGPRRLVAGNKAITTQWGVDNVFIRNVDIERANSSGLSIEPGSNVVEVTNVNCDSSGYEAVLAYGVHVTVRGVHAAEAGTQGSATRAAVSVGQHGELVRAEILDVYAADCTDGRGVIAAGATESLIVDRIRIGDSGAEGLLLVSCTGANMIGLVEAPNSSVDVARGGTTPASSVHRFAQPAAETIFINAIEMTPTNGGPAMGTGGTGLPSFQMDAAVLEGVAVVIGRDRIPAHWRTLAVDIVWANQAASSGDVRWDASHNWMADADAFAFGTYVNGTPVAAPTTAAVQKTTRVITTSTIQKARLIVRVIRNGPDGGDTLANDAMLAGIRLVRVT